MKGKPWSVEEEKQLREMVQEHKRLNEIAGVFGKSLEAVRVKIRRLGLVVVDRKKKIICSTTTTSNLTLPEEAMRQKIRRLRLEVVGAKGYRTTTSIKMPKELPSVDEALKDLVTTI